MLNYRMIIYKQAIRFFNTCYVLGMMLAVVKTQWEIGDMGMILILVVSYLKMSNE